MYLKKIILAAALITLTPFALAAQNKVVSRYSIDGHVATGANRFLDRNLWFMDGGLGTASFQFVFGYNPDGDEPIQLTEDTPGNTLLATGLDSNFLAALGLTSANIDKKFINKPYQEVQVIINPFTIERASVPLELDAEAIRITRSSPLNNHQLKLVGLSDIHRSIGGLNRRLKEKASKRRWF